MRLAFPSTAILLAAALPAFGQDLTIVSKIVHNSGAPETATSYISSDHVRMASGEGSDAIVDFKTGTMTILDAKKKTYSVVTRQELEDMIARMKEQMNSPEVKRAQEQMKNLPPEIRERMSKMMGAASEFSVQKTGTHRTIAGYPCDDWTMTIGR